jgi:hypothetical protein
MYRDDDSIRQFERQHARDTLAKLARTLPDDPDTDLVSGHSAAERKEASLSATLSVFAIAALIALIFFILAPA